MSDMEELYADTIDEIHFTGNMVRLDFGTVQPPESEDKEPTIKRHFRVIMPLNGMFSSMDSMQGLIDKLVNAGVIQKKE